MRHDPLDGPRRRLIEAISRSADRLGDHWCRYEREQISGNAESRLGVLDEIEAVRRRIARLAEMLAG